MVAPLSVCEVEVTPKGPSGNRHILQTAGGMWPLQLQGVALASHDRIRIVADTVLCGLEGSATMHDAVLALTAPMGQRAHGDFRSETWENIQINRRCAKQQFCIAVSNQRVFFTERATHMLRWLDIEEGDFGSAFNAQLSTPLGLALALTLIRLMMRSDSVVCRELSSTVLSDMCTGSIYIADYGSDRVRKIDLTQDPLNRGWLRGRPSYVGHDCIQRAASAIQNLGQTGIIETVAGNGFRGFSGDGGPAREAQLNGPSGVAVDLNQMLWICIWAETIAFASALARMRDSGNNVLRVVSMEIPVRIPGSNEFEANVILTAAGGSTGQSQGKGDGGVAWLARMQGPSGVAVSSAFVSNEDPALPSPVTPEVVIGFPHRTARCQSTSTFRKAWASRRDPRLPS
ncbi:unnamed protein product [Symbiodinium sp. CCMP2592]|nr:unnamed protein product [Symbiodinium sp. CCMP2592]